MSTVILFILGRVNCNFTVQIFWECGAALNCFKKNLSHVITQDKLDSMHRPFRPFNFEILMLDNKGSRRIYCYSHSFFSVLSWLQIKINLIGAQI